MATATLDTPRTTIAAAPEGSNPLAGLDSAGLRRLLYGPATAEDIPTLEAVAARSGVAVFDVLPATGDPSPGPALAPPLPVPKPTPGREMAETASDLAQALVVTRPGCPPRVRGVKIA